MNHQYLKNVSTLKLFSDRCTGCGRCMEVCPHQVLAIENKKAILVNKNRCMECGACVKNCPFNALEVKAGVGCAYAVILGWMKGTKPSCGTSGSSSGCC